MFEKWKPFSQNSPQNCILETSTRHTKIHKKGPTFSSKIPERIDVKTIKWDTPVRKCHESPRDADKENMFINIQQYRLLSFQIRCFYNDYEQFKRPFRIPQVTFSKFGMKCSMKCSQVNSQCLESLPGIEHLPFDFKNAAKPISGHSMQFLIYL